MNTDSIARGIANFRSEMAVVNGVQLHYWIGDPNGMPVLLWHGFLGTGYSWHKVMPLLGEAGFSILVPDMRGYGDSDKPAGDEGYDSRALAEEFRALVRQIEFGAGQSLLLAAHDMGLGGAAEGSGSSTRSAHVREVHADDVVI
jgi:pimeloyl-ACP methyl ester carboxylesterase